MTNKQLLSERLAQTRKTFTGDVFDWMTGYGLTGLISDVRALEAENQRLKEQCSATSLDKEICSIKPLHDYDKLLNNFEREMRAEVAKLRREREGSDLALERDSACAERDALRAEMETLQRDKDGRIREAFDRMSVAIRERDEARYYDRRCQNALVQCENQREEARIERDAAIETSRLLRENTDSLCTERDEAENREEQALRHVEKLRNSLDHHNSLLDTAYAERDALRADVEKLKDSDAGVATLMYAQAIRERDEARAKLAEEFTTLKIEREAWVRMADAEAERDAALAKLAAVREWSGRVFHIETPPHDLLAILDGSPKVEKDETQVP